MVALSPYYGNVLPKRWTTLRPHAVQARLWNATEQFLVVPAGRRSGKTEILKRMCAKLACEFYKYSDGWFVLGAPTHAQAERIFWRDMKRLVPTHMIQHISESKHTITLINDARISIIGMDVPQRIEGSPLDFIGLDEFGNMKPSIWFENVFPMLSERDGRAYITGVPEGRNHYFDMYEFARMEIADGNTEDWGIYEWFSEDILSKKAIALAKKTLDPLTYQQEYEASFVSFSGRAYYPFSVETHVKSCRQFYDPTAPLILCFDFNVEPGVCAIIQEYPEGTFVIGEVHIEKNSSTEAVCRRVLMDWGEHTGHVYLYGDATGGARGTAQTRGSDWDIIRQDLGPAFKAQGFTLRVPKANPLERVRVNALNRRLRSADGEKKLFVDPRCRHMIRDLDGVALLKGSAGEIDKKTNLALTHISDAIGYYVVAKYPLKIGAPTNMSVQV